MAQSGVAFGTSGARGRVEAMSERVCYAYTAAFLQYLEQSEQLAAASAVAIGGDLRPSTPRIMGAVARAIADRGHRAINCGTLPSPALALFGITQGMASIMVTGSHIPDDRNGIKFNTPRGEILKRDERAITAQQLTLPPGLFDDHGNATEALSLPAPEMAATEAYIRRYLEFFPAGCLQTLRVGLYEHSAVGREIMARILTGLGAEVVRLERSERFVPVDTEAVRPEDVDKGRRWAAEFGLDAIVSSDGDGDRPLISDEQGNWLRGDVAGILCARFLGADAVITPISSNTALERSGWFGRVLRTRIGSPYVIEAMQQAATDGAKNVVGYEANGGFLTWHEIEQGGRRLPPLPTRDAMIVALALLVMSRGSGIVRLLAQLPARYTASDRVKAFPSEQSSSKLAALTPRDGERLDTVAAAFGAIAGPPLSVNTTDGVRITFENGEIIHLRASGNAPELRCYVEAGSGARSAQLLAACMQRLSGWQAEYGNR